MQNIKVFALVTAAILMACAVRRNFPSGRCV